MSRYIDADALLKSAVSKFKCVPSVGVIYCGNGEEIFDGEDLQDFIRAMPTADVVEVVRCKDCVHCHISIDPKTKTSVQVCGYVGYNPVQSSQVTDNDYCSHGEGERREE